MLKKSKILGLVGNFSNNNYKKDYIFQILLSSFALLFSFLNFYLLSTIDFTIIGFFAFQETVTTLIMATSGNFFAFSATRRKNNNKYIAPLLVLQIFAIVYICLIAFLAKNFLEGNFNIQFTFSIPLIILIGMRRTFYCLKINTSISKKNYILSTINLSENICFFILLFLLKIFISNNEFSTLDYDFNNLIIIFKFLSNLIPVLLSIYFTLKFLRKIKISWLFLKAKSFLLLSQGLKFIPLNLTRKITKTFSILLTSFIDANLLSLVAIANKAVYPQILLDGIIRRSAINQIRKEIPKTNTKGIKIFFISTLFGILMFPFLVLLVKNSQYNNLSEFIFYYFLFSLSISLRGFAWFSNSIVAKYSLRFGYFASILGLTQPLFLAIFYKLPFNLSILECLGISLVLTSIVIIYFWKSVKKNLSLRYNFKNLKNI